MKTLKNLVKTENLNIDELMLIKGAVAGSPICGGSIQCNTHGCTASAGQCTSNQCTSTGCSSTVERDNPAR